MDRFEKIFNELHQVSVQVALLQQALAESNRRSEEHLVMTKNLAGQVHTLSIPYAWLAFSIKVGSVFGGGLAVVLGFLKSIGVI